MKITLHNIKVEKKKVLLLECKNMCFYSDGIYAICGNNGVGKTTLLNVLATLTKATSGKILIDDKEIKEKYEIKKYRENITLFRNASEFLFSELTVFQNITFYCNLNGIRIDEKTQNLERLCKSFGIDGSLYQQVKRLSKGLKQKVALVIVFLLGKSIILLDEPYDGLDSNGIKALDRTFEYMRKDRIIAFTSPLECTKDKFAVIEM